MNFCAAFIGDFDSTFPELKGLPEDADRMPGREVADMIVHGLRAKGFEPSAVANEEPFYESKLRHANREWEISVGLAGEYEEKPVWSVQCGTKVSFVEKLQGVDLTSGAPILEAIQETLKNNPRVHEVHWFQELPLDPFDKDEAFSASPCEVSLPKPGSELSVVGKYDRFSKRFFKLMPPLWITTIVIMLITAVFVRDEKIREICWKVGGLVITGLIGLWLGTNGLGVWLVAIEDFKTPGRKLTVGRILSLVFSLVFSAVFLWLAWLILSAIARKFF